MADFDSSPLMKSALEVLCHSIEHFVAATPKDHRLAVLHLAQAVELASKGVLVEHNRPIYDVKNEGRTLSWRQCLERLGTLWSVEPPPQMARLELLMDERNGMQHRFGTVDPLTIDYHLGTVFRFLEELMEREYQADLHQFLREALPEEVWHRCRYVKDETQARIDRAAALVEEGDPTSGLLEAFAALDGAVLSSARGSRNPEPSSTLDVLMRFGERLADSGRIPRNVMPKLANLYRLRNAAVHANEQPPARKVTEAINSAEVFLRALADPENAAALDAAMTDAMAASLARHSELERPELAEAELLAVIARQQLANPPPRFVGFALMARQTGAQARLDEMTSGGLLVAYRVPNPVSPDWPTAAVRINVDSSAVAELLDPELLEEVRLLTYEDLGVD